MLRRQQRRNRAVPSIKNPRLRLNGTRRNFPYTASLDVANVPCSCARVKLCRPLPSCSTSASPIKSTNRAKVSVSSKLRPRYSAKTRAKNAGCNTYAHSDKVASANGKRCKVSRAYASNRSLFCSHRNHRSPPTLCSACTYTPPSCSQQWPGVPRFSSRRRGDGTHRRSGDPKQGRSRRQPRPGRRAKTCSITSVPGKAAGVGETGGSGRSSEEERDNITRWEPRTRGPWWSQRRPEAGWSEKPTRTAGGPRNDEGAIKLGGLWGYADLVLNSSRTLRQGRVD